MRKALVLIFLAVVAPHTAQAYSNDELMSYVAMPLAVSDVVAVRGVQTDQVGSLVYQMNRANVPPESFIDVFRYVPVALVFNDGRRPDFVQWVSSQVDQGVVGDELVTVMERRLTSYGDVVTTRTTRVRRTPQLYTTAFSNDYVPATVVRYSENALYEPFALIDMPIAVTHVIDLGVPLVRVGGLVTELNLGLVSPVQTVEILRYAPPVLVAPDYDLVQVVRESRISGITSYGLVRVVDRQFAFYDITPSIDVVAPVYANEVLYAPPIVTNYVDPIEPTWIPRIVRTRFASQVAVAPASPQVERLLSGSSEPTVVVSPKQARRELAHSKKAEREAARVTVASPQRLEPQRVAKPQRVVKQHPQQIKVKLHEAPPARVIAPPAAKQHQNRGRGGEKHVNRVTAPSMQPAMQPKVKPQKIAPQRQSQPPQSQPQQQPKSHGGGQGKGKGHKG